MAFRLEDSVISGVLDFRERGIVSGLIELDGEPGTLELSLKGCPWRDLAGFKLEFSNPKHAGKPRAHGLTRKQEGAVGDMTASRKVKIPDIPLDEIGHYLKTGLPLPFHWANSLYLEWYSESNGRVVIESAEYELILSTDPTWLMTEAEELEQRAKNREALGGFMHDLGELISEEVEDSDEPISSLEAEADAEAARMDLLLDRIQARMEREDLPPEELERVIDEERERLRVERGEPEPEPDPPEDAFEQAARLEEAKEAVNNLFENLSTEPRPPPPEHPLVIASRDLALRLHHEGKRSELFAQGANQEHPMIEMMDGVMIASAKLAGALNRHAEGDTWPPDRMIAGSTLVRLKKAREYLKDAIRGLDSAEEERLADPAWLSSNRRQIELIQKTVDDLIQEVRDSL